MLRHRFIITAVIALVLLSLASLVTQAAPTAPAVMSFQGYVAVNGVPFDGTGQFKFAIVNSSGTAAFWTNDGTGLSAAPFEPNGSVSLDVNGGVFNVLLGDPSLNMAPLPDSLFVQADRSLRVWFNDGTHGFQMLSPDAALATTPFAFNADRLDGMDADVFVTDGEVNSLMSAADYITMTLADTRYAAASHTQPWGSLTGVPSGLDDGDGDALAALNCADSDIPKWSAVTLTWTCAADDSGTAYTAGDGLTLAGAQFGVDATVRYRPLQRAIYRRFMGRTELIWSRRAEDVRNVTAFGMYASGDYQFARRWFGGARYDRAARAYDSALVDSSGSLVLTYWPSEFSQVRGQLRRTKYAEGVIGNEALFQFLFSIGAHGAHVF